MKKLLLTIATMAIMGGGCAQDLVKESNKAANQAKNGEVVRASNTASKTWQNNDMPKGNTYGLDKLVERKVQEAEKQRQSATKPKNGKTSSNTTKKVPSK